MSNARKAVDAVWDDELDALVQAMNAPYSQSFDELLQKAQRDNERMLEDERGDMWFGYDN